MYRISILNRFTCASFENGEGTMKEGRIGISFARETMNVLRGKIKSGGHTHVGVCAHRTLEETKCVFDVVQLGRIFLHTFDIMQYFEVLAADRFEDGGKATFGVLSSKEAGKRI